MGLFCRKCRNGQICENGECVDRCYSDDDCPEGEVCSDGTCSVPLPAGVICDEITAEVLTDYIRACRISGDCDTSRHVAFETLDFTGFADGVGTNDYGYNYINSNIIYCCQDGRNCDDGFTGCQPECAACCDVEDCTGLIYCQDEMQFFFCVDDVCANFILQVPDLWTGEGDAYLIGHYADLDWENTVYTCDELKALRVAEFNNTSPACQRQSGKTDADFPCTIKLQDVVSISGRCPTACLAK